MTMTGVESWSRYKELDGKCQRCGGHMHSITYEVDFADRLICSHCNAGIQLFMGNNFATVLRDPTKIYRRKEEQYPIMKVLETREHHRAVRDFMMAHPEIEYGAKLRRNSKLAKELEKAVFG